MSSISRNMRRNARKLELVRTGQQGKDGALGSSVTLEARKNGAVIHRMDLPAEEPQAVFTFLQQSLAAMATAAQQFPQKRLVLGVMPRWKAWVIQHILRAI